MKIVKSLTFLLLISRCRCGLIEGVFGAVTKTTHDIAHNVGGIFSLGHGSAFSEKGNKNPTDAGVLRHTKGLLGGLFDSVHDNVRNFEESIKNVFTTKYTKDNGALGNMADRVKNRVVNIKDLILGSVEKPREFVNKTHDNLTDKTKPIRDHLNKFIFGNRTKNSNMNDMIKVLDDIKKKLNDIRNKPGIKDPDFVGKPEDGAGLIDIRAAFDDIEAESHKIAQENDKRNSHGRHDLANIGKQGNKLKNNFQTFINDIESNVKNSLNRDKQLMDEAYKNINENTLVFRD